jgi:hypothetical protein
MRKTDPTLQALREQAGIYFDDSAVLQLPNSLTLPDDANNEWTKDKLNYAVLASGKTRVDYMLGLRTAIRGLKQWQVELADERDCCASEYAARYLRHSATSKKGGAASVQSRRAGNIVRDRDIAEEAKKLLSNGHASHEICGILAKRFVNENKQENFSARQIRNILQEHGVLKKKRK